MRNCSVYTKAKRLLKKNHLPSTLTTTSIPTTKIKGVRTVIQRLKYTKELVLMSFLQTLFALCRQDERKKPTRPGIHLDFDNSTSDSIFIRVPIFKKTQDFQDSIQSFFIDFRQANDTLQKRNFFKSAGTTTQNYHNFNILTKSIMVSANYKSGKVIFKIYHLDIYVDRVHLILQGNQKFSRLYYSINRQLSFRKYDYKYEA